MYIHVTIFRRIIAYVLRHKPVSIFVQKCRDKAEAHEHHDVYVLRSNFDFKCARAGMRVCDIYFCSVCGICLLCTWICASR